MKFFKLILLYLLPSILYGILSFTIPLDFDYKLSYSGYFILGNGMLLISNLIHLRLRYSNIQFETLMTSTFIFTLISLGILVSNFMLVGGISLDEELLDFDSFNSELIWISSLVQFGLGGILSSFLPKSSLIQKFKNLFKVVLFVIVIYKIIQRLSKVQDVLSGGFDTTGDGLTDTNFIDTDGDGINDTIVQDTDGDGLIDTVISDTDGDGIIDTIVMDTDGDGIADLGFKDTDGDGKIDKLL